MNSIIILNAATRRTVKPMQFEMLQAPRHTKSVISAQEPRNGNAVKPI